MTEYQEQEEAAAPMQSDGPEDKLEPAVFKTGYTGFLILTCGECGKTYTVNAREPMQETTCRACGQVTELKEMAAVEMLCPACGKTWRYKTNSEQADVTARCIQCGELMVSEWDIKLRRYVPQKQEETL